MRRVSDRPHDHRRNVAEFIKFGIVGGSGVLVNMAVAIVMNKANGGTAHAQDPLFTLPWPHWTFRFSDLVWIVAFIVANVVNFQLNRTWTFRRTERRGWWAEFWPFFAIGSVAAVAGVFIKAALRNPASTFYLSGSFFHEGAGLHSREYWAQIITIVITMPINFIVNKLWTFRAVRHDEDIPLVAPAVAPELVDEGGDPIDDSSFSPAGEPGRPGRS